MKRCFILYTEAYLLLMLVFLAYSCGEDSRPPIIFSMTAEPDMVSPGERTLIAVKAGDPDKDKLTYVWAASGGNIEGSGETITWLSPQVEGRYELTVAVSDGSDSVTKTLSILVWRDYYPLAVGNKWTFKDSKGNTIEFEIINTITISSTGTTAFVKQMTTSGLEGAVTYSYIARKSDTVYQYAMGGSNAGDDTILFSPELPLFRYPLNLGKTWNVTFNVELPPVGYYVGHGTAIYEVVSEEDLTIEAGSFRRVFKVKEDFTWEMPELGMEIDHIIAYYWIAPDVGIVKFFQEENIGGETIVTDAVLQSYSLK